MKYLFLLVILTVSGYLLFQKSQKKAAPPPAPIEVAPLEPSPMISEEEQAKVVKTANDDDPMVRWEALNLLDKMKAPAAYPVLFDKLRKDMDVDLRIKIIRLLAERKHPDISQNLIRATKDMTPEVRVAALQALEKLGDYTAASAITDTLKDPEDAVRLQALRTLNVLQDKRTADLQAEQKRQEDLRRQQAAEEAKRNK